MSKFSATVEYDGTNYHGWQLQDTVPTIQGSIELALERIFHRLIRVHGAGRTDAGVHAKGQVIHFSLEWPRPSHDLERALNAVLPADIALRELKQVPYDFHARHSAVSKKYCYHVLNRSLRSPLARLYTLHVQKSLDLGAMQEAAQSLLGQHDFAAFGSPTDGTPSTVRNVLEAGWNESERKTLLIFSIRATGFLRYMVRCLVGTLLKVGIGKISPQQFGDILKSAQRSRSGPTAPPQGLFLVHVDYAGADEAQGPPTMP